jgi:hypothetical protein
LVAQDVPPIAGNDDGPLLIGTRRLRLHREEPPRFP